MTFDGYEANLTVWLSPLAKRRPPVPVLFGVATTCIAAVAILGNSVVLAAFVANKKLRKDPGNAFITNLAATDLLSALFVIVPRAVAMLCPCFEITFAGCQAYIFLGCAAISASNFTLAVISYDRALAVRRCLQYATLMTTFKVRVLLGVTWLTALSMGVVPLTARWIVFEDQEGLCSLSWESKPYKGSVTLYFMVLMFFGVPFCVLVYFNAKILMCIYGLKEVRFRPECEPEGAAVTGYRVGQNPDRRRNAYCSTSAKKSLKSFYFLMAVYVVCFLPYAVIRFATAVGGLGALPTWVVVPSGILQLCSSALNPFVYAILRKEYRLTVIKMYKTVREKLKPFKGT